MTAWIDCSNCHIYKIYICFFNVCISVSKRIWWFLYITGIVTLPCLGVVLLPPDVRLQSPLQFSAELFSSSVTQSPCMKNRSQSQKAKYFCNYIEYFIKYEFITCLYNNFGPVTKKNIFEKKSSLKYMCLVLRKCDHFNLMMKLWCGVKSNNFLAFKIH